MDALRQGGTAVDAAIAVALTQVATNLGAVVSYAGVAELVYYEARTRRVYALDAGWGTYAAERDPGSIPAMDVGVVTGDARSTIAPAQGRKTLVPGFMAGLEAAHGRFGRVAWGDLFAPSIWYARHGVRITPILSAWFKLQAPQLSRTEEGRRFLDASGGNIPRVGDRFAQPDLAALLEGVAHHGSAHMYAGPWARAFVETVRREGGAATLDDLRRYRPDWETTRHIGFAGGEVVGPGDANASGRAILAALDRLSANPPAQPYWRDPAAFAAYSAAVRAGLIETFASGHHSAAVVVVDKAGNVAALVHSINAPMWGDTGIVVQGVPLSGAAGLYKARLAALPAGGRVPSDMAPVVALRAGRPVLAVASVGSSLHHETVGMVAAGLLGQDLAEAMAAPPLLLNINGTAVEPIPAGAYPGAFTAELERLGVSVQEQPAERVAALRGTVAFAQISPEGVSSAEAPQTVTFGQAR